MMKKLNEQTDQSIGIIFSDQNGNVIDPSTLDINVTLTTGVTSISFSAN